LKRDWDVMLKRYQAEMERLHLSGEWQTIVSQFEEALAKGQWQPFAAQFEAALEAAAKALDQSADRDQAAAAEQALKREIERAKVEVDRTRALFERGLVSQTQMAEMEARLKALSQRMAEDVQKHEMLAKHQEQQHDREKLAAEVARHQKDRAAEIEQVKRLIEEHLKASLHDRAEEMDKAKRALNEHLQATRQARESEVAMLKHERNMAPVDGPAAAGDVLEVRIGGEPDLPTHYDIRADGTIRLPFLGAFKVVGQTAAQVQAAVGKQIADRKLGPANQVTVSVLRRR
jgi:hypothetical protein